MKIIVKWTNKNEISLISSQESDDGKWGSNVKKINVQDVKSHSKSLYSGCKVY